MMDFHIGPKFMTLLVLRGFMVLTEAGAKNRLLFQPLRSSRWPPMLGNQRQLVAAAAIQLEGASSAISALSCHKSR